MRDPAETVTLPADEHDELLADAEKWRALASSPHLADLLREWWEWRRRRDMSASTADMARLYDWRAIANAPTYAELQRRRDTYATEPLTAAQITLRARASWAEHEGRAAA